MPLSTSSSSDRAPSGRWALTWGVAIVLLVAALAGWKAYWTAQGFGVSVTNDLSLWAGARTRLQSEGTVLIGTSRIQAAINPDTWAETTGGDPPLQLALVGSTPLPLLEHLAMETDFRGIAIVGIVEMYLFDTAAGNLRASDAIAEYRALLSSPSRRAGLTLNRYVPVSLLVRHRRLNFAGVIEAMWKRHAPVNPVANIQKDRWMEFEADRLEPDDFDYTEFETAGTPATVAERDSIIAAMGNYVDMIQSRGGNVVLVAFPACGNRREIETRRYPRALYWEPLAAETSARVINAYDIPELMLFTCADGSHLDQSDSRRITREIVRIVGEGL